MTIELGLEASENKSFVAFFAYPNKPGVFTAEGTRFVTLSEAGDDAKGAVEALAGAVGAGATTRVERAVPIERGEVPDGALTADAITTIVARTLPEGAIVVDESITSGRQFFALSQGSAPHDYLQLTGGAIGSGIPMASGAAVACPGRKVINLQADGSAMYTVQGLWTQARERSDVVTIIFANNAYRILQGEMRGVGVNEVGRNAQRMLDLDDPTLDWVPLARGLGVEAVRATTVKDFARAFAAALSEPGPSLIEAVI